LFAGIGWCDDNVCVCRYWYGSAYEETQQETTLQI